MHLMMYSIHIISAAFHVIVLHMKSI